MAVVSRWDLGVWDQALFDSWQTSTLAAVRRTERTTAPVATRTDIVRAERTTAPAATRIDE